MPAYDSSEQQNDIIQPYKTPLSANIIAGLALFWLLVGILLIVLPLIGVIKFEIIFPDTSVFPNNNTLSATTLIPFILLAFGCFLISAILFVVYNIACDTHCTAYYLQHLIRYTQKNQKHQIKQLQYIDDSITRQSNIIIQQLKSNSNDIPQRPNTQRRTIPHDGAY